MLFGEIVAVYCEARTEHTDVLCGQAAEFYYLTCNLAVCKLTIQPLKTEFVPNKLALTSPTSGGRSVGIVRSRTKATELVS
jgi:hypothetical protein